MTDHATARPTLQTPPRYSLLAAGCALLASACAGPGTISKTDWLPDFTGWHVRDVDDHVPMRWVLYQRDAAMADVKELRIVGVVEAEPAAVARALRQRLLDDTTLPEGAERRLLRESESEVEFYGFNALPFPFDDREVNERLRFAHDASTGVHTVHVKDFDPGDAPKPGVLRIPVVQNRFVIAPVGAGRSVVTMDTVHDLGGYFPNWAIYGPIADYLVQELNALNELTAPAKAASH